MLEELVFNAALLVVLSVFYEILVRYRQRRRMWIHLLMGGLFGGVAVAVMIVPLEYSEGIIFDGRTVVMSLAGLFGGPLVAIVSSVIAVGYRLWLGGAGALAGIVFIVLAGLTGVMVRRHILKKQQIVPGFHALVVTAFITHVLMLAGMLLLPWPEAYTAIKDIAVPVMLLFPAATVLMGWLMMSAEKRILAETEVRENEALYRTTLYSIGDAVVLTNRKGWVQKMNPEAARLTGWTEKEARGRQYLPVSFAGA